MRRCFLYLLMAVVTISLLLPSASAQTVVSRIKIGGYAEGITYIASGSNAGSTAFLRGADVYAYRNIFDKAKTPTKLFDLMALPVGMTPRGIAYIASTQQFAFADSTQPDRLVLSDEKGHPAGSIIFQYPEGETYRTNRFEGLGYIPADSPNYPDHLAVVTFWEPNLAGQTGPHIIRIFIVGRDGVIDKVITPQLPEIGPTELHPDGLYPYDLGGVAFQAPATLVCGEADIAWKIDFDGNLVGDPVEIPANGTWMEGVTALADGTIVVSAGRENLWALDADLNLRPELTREITVGVGLQAEYLGWNPDTGEFLVGDRSFYTGVWSVPETFASKTLFRQMEGLQVTLPDPADDEPNHLMAFRTYGITYRSDTHQVALSYSNQNKPVVPARARIVLLDGSGELVAYQRLSDWNATPQFSPSMISYIPAEAGEPARYVMRGVAPSNNVLKFVSPVDGTEVGSISLAAAGVTGIVNVEYFNLSPGDPAGRRFLVFTNGNRALLTDFSGTVLSEFDYRQMLNVIDAGEIAYIDRGAFAGAFATVANSGNEIVIFRLGQKKNKNK